ncbi:MAG TPA: hypothetical protein VFY53_13560 [Rhodoplanes sp.]|nr:hypothetical protein [Rhodoplanes sp.]
MTIRKVVYQFMAPVQVEVEDDIVTKVVVLDETPVNQPTFVEGDRKYLRKAVVAVAASDNGQSWPAWEFGY